MDIIEKNQQRIMELASTSPHLAKQVEELDWSELESALEECIFTKDEIGLPKNYGPATYFPLLPESAEQNDLYKKAYLHGESLIRTGKTAAFTVAGGQGTRLGYDGPKGTLPVTPIKKKTLFQLRKMIFTDLVKKISAFLLKASCPRPISRVTCSSLRRIVSPYPPTDMEARLKL
jgi:UDP-N-acetylglucosamine/UDP-N-acetylgalactosamine diphosphorylase